MDQRPQNIRAKTIKFSEKHPGPWIRQFLYYDTKTQATTTTKTEVWTSKLNIFVLKDTVKKLEDNPKHGRKCFQSMYLMKDLYLEHINMTTTQ